MKNRDKEGGASKLPASPSKAKARAGPQEANSSQASKPEDAPEPRSQRASGDSAPKAEGNAEGPTSQAQEKNDGGQTKNSQSGPACDVSEELSRQLEDILNTYCVDSSQEGPGDEGGQSEHTEPDEVEKSRNYSARNGEPEPGTPEVNGVKEITKGEPGIEEIRANDESGDRDQKRVQEKKKAKGLGKEITLLMQTLNTLSTPEEKLAALCKKYAELVSPKHGSL